MKGWQRFTCGEMHHIAGITETHSPTKNRWEQLKNSFETLTNSCCSTKIEYDTSQWMPPLAGVAAYLHDWLSGPVDTNLDILKQHHVFDTNRTWMIEWIHCFRQFCLKNIRNRVGGASLWMTLVLDLISSVESFPNTNKILLYILCVWIWLHILKLSSSHLFPIFFLF